MKLIIQIPAYNEEASLPLTLRQLPRHISGVSEIEWLVIDDGSTDRTSEVARAAGVDHVVRFRRNRGLARAFAAGLSKALVEGADVIVQTDADNQYRAEDLPLLIGPILDGTADMVVGERPMERYSLVKRLLQRLGTKVVRGVSGADIRDAASGFRAFSRETARSMKVFNDFTYTVETVIQAGLAGWAVRSVPVRTNPDLRPSRLFRSNWKFVRRQAVTIIRILMAYRPLKFFGIPGVVSFLSGFLIGVRFLYFYFTGTGGGHVQSLILSALLMGLGAALILIGLVADLMSVNRKMLQSLESQVFHLEELLASRPGMAADGAAGRLPDLPAGTSIR